MNYFNEIDPYAAQWLRNLIDAGHIAPGVVDTRSIVDVAPGDLAGFRQCHFFAGVGVWSLALRRAGVPDDADVWTGSCPCQPFSAAGKGDGMDDERHLWPHFEWLIRQRRPAVVLGEQVASKDADPWIDLVQTDLEALGYAFGAVAFPSAGVGAPHIRDRTYWVAHAERGNGRRQHGGRLGGASGASESGAQQRQRLRTDSADGGAASGLADANRGQCDGVAVIGGNERVGHDAGRTQECGESQPCGDLCGMADAADQRQHGRGPGEAGHGGYTPRVEFERLRSIGEAGPVNGLWRDADWLLCRDGKWRPVGPGTFPLAHGAPARVVYTCATCKIETVTSDEGMRTVRNFPRGHEGLRTSALLLNEVLRSVDNGRPHDTSEGEIPSAISICSAEMRAVRERPARGEAPPRWECDEQRARQYREALQGLPRSRASAATHADLQSLRDGVSGAEVAQLDMFCPVCAGVGPHQRRKEVGGSRVGRLRGYGNAINVEAARVFIECAMGA